MPFETPVDIGSLITCRPGVYGGRPCLGGTRFPVSMVAAYIQGERGLDALFEDFSFLDVSWVHAAAAYYYSNKRQFDLRLHDDAAFGEMAGTLQDAGLLGFRNHREYWQGG